MPHELLTKDDLEIFRKTLISDIKNLISANKREEKEWLRCSDVRTMLNISTGTLQNLRMTGKLRSHKVGGIHFYKRSDIEGMIRGKQP